jgi:hypothetical protein
MAEIFLNSLETDFLDSDHFPFKNNIVKWIRYVDDIFCIFNGTERQISLLHSYINGLHRKIKFTIEHNTDNTINYLDMTLKIIDHKINFNIYRKPTHTDTVIHSSSAHPISHKHASFHSMIDRLVRTPLTPSDYKTELNTIKQIAINNHYDPSLVHNILNKKLKTQLYRQYIYHTYNFREQTDKTWRKILYLKDLTEKVTKTLPKNIQPAFYTNNKLSNILVNTKTKTDMLQKSGVYELTCNDCNHKYIGQSCRNIKTRLQEHKRCLSNNNFSEFANHIHQTDHNFDNHTIKLLHHTTHRGLTLNALETIEIIKNKNTSNTLINNITFTDSSPLLQIFPINRKNNNNSFPRS